MPLATWTFQPPYQNDTIGNAAWLLREGKRSPDIYPSVVLIEKDGTVWSVDNRRILTFRSAGMDVPYQKFTYNALTPAQKRHFTGTGESIIIREVTPEK